jgi:hypothetical protein
MPEEVRFLGRLAAYGLLIGVVYWFVSYEVAGTVLLLAFGVATGFATVVLLLDVRRTGRGGGLRRRPLDWVALTSTGDDPPFGDEPAGVPVGSVAPLEIGLGLAIASLGLVFGPWLVPLGLVPIVVGASVWIRETMGEHRIARALDSDTDGRGD